MRPFILVTLDHEGSNWTVCLERSPLDGDAGTLHFVRDWAEGGSSRIVVPISDDLRQLLAEGPGSWIEPRLRFELAQALKRVPRRDDDAGPAHWRRANAAGRR